MEMTDEEINDKIMDMKEAVDKFVDDGDTVFIQWQSFAPIAAEHEMIRQGKEDLTLTSASLAHGGDLMVGSGCVSKVITGYLGVELVGLSHCFRRAVEEGIPQEIEVEEYANFNIQMMNLAAALGFPFTPSKNLLASDYLRKYPDTRRFKEAECPFSGEKVVLLPSLAPDVGFFQAQRADARGNVQTWGAGIEFGLFACDKVVACVEEICEEEVIRRDPDRTILPNHKVAAVVHEPWGGSPRECVWVLRYRLDVEISSHGCFFRTGDI